MLPDDLLHLLTTAADGELTAFETVRLRRVLTESREAEEVLAQLQDDCFRLRQLTELAPPVDLTARIMARLPSATTTPVDRPTRPVRLPAPPTRRPWVPVAVAASVFLAVTGGSFVYFLGQPIPTSAGTHVADATRAPATVSPVVGPGDTTASLRHTASVPPAAVPPPNVVTRKPDGPDEIPLPRAVTRDVNAFPPVLPIPPLDSVQVRVPFLAAVSDFGREDVRRQLAEELGRDPAFRIDVFAKDVSRGAELFQAAAKGSGFALHTDAAAQDRIKRKMAAGYFVYADGVTPGDVRGLFARLAAADARAPQTVFDTVHVTPAQPADHRDIRDVLGTDPGQWKRALPVPGPEAKAPEKSAVLMTFAPPGFRTPPAASRELRQFLDARGERTRTGLLVVIVIRPTN